MKKFIYAIITAVAVLLTSCHDAPDYSSTSATDTFDCLWETLDTRYCYFGEKGVDWDAIGERYRKRIIPGINSEELFRLCAQMLNELRDGHVNLSTPFAQSYFREWWTAYPQDFDYRTVQQYYLGFDYLSIGSIDYKILPSNIAYIRYPSFSYIPGEGNLDYMFNYLAVCDAVIIDIRDNGGGEVTNIKPFVSRLIHEKMTGGYIRHKTGPGHDDFSEPYPVEYEPAKKGHIVWNKPVAVLTNRSCFSAANDFVAVMKEVPGVIIVGARTGGGGGMPFNAELPNGWRVRFSSSPMLDVSKRSIEDGIDPTPGCEAHSPAEELAAGKDGILDRAIELLTK